MVKIWDDDEDNKWWTKYKVKCYIFYEILLIITQPFVAFKNAFITFLISQVYPLNSS